MALLIRMLPCLTCPHRVDLSWRGLCDVHLSESCSMLTRHELQVDCQGLAGDTVHMARLWSSSRKGKLNYSLESLSGYGLSKLLHICTRGTVNSQGSSRPQGLGFMV